MHHPAHKSLKAAYSFYNIHTETPLLDLMSDALVIAKLVGDSLLAVLCVRLQIRMSNYISVLYFLPHRRIHLRYFTVDHQSKEEF